LRLLETVSGRDERISEHGSGEYFFPEARLAEYRWIQRYQSTVYNWETERTIRRQLEYLTSLVPADCLNVGIDHLTEA